MTKATKPELLAKAKELNLEVTEESTVAELEAAIKAATPEAPAAKAKTWKIKTPVKNFTGVSRGVAFVEGEGTTDNEWFAQRCKEAGYKVTEV